MIEKRSLSSFSVILIMATMMLVGVAMIPLLTVKLQPTVTRLTLSVHCSWSGASASLLEKEVISKLEGTFARIRGVTDITSVSNSGSGSIDLTFEKGTNMQVARFEVASQIRYVYPSLPDGVSYPSLSSAPSGSLMDSHVALTYIFNTHLPGNSVADFFDNIIIPELSKISGIYTITYGGITPWEYEITVDMDKSALAGITMNEIATAFNGYFNEYNIGNVRYGENNENVILLKVRNPEEADFMSIPIRNSNGRIYGLSDLVSVRYRESLPDYYSRVNGLNTINLNVSANRNSNLALACNEVQKQMRILDEQFPPGLTAELIYNGADHINKELQTIFLRTLFTFIILMLFVLLASRNLKYLLIIFLTLVANILVAVVFYYILHLEIHIYSLAGITVSLGIIIDTSIIMTDHYSFYHNKRAFTALFGAVLTTIAAISVVFLLPERLRDNFLDFSWVIIINLAVSLLISYMFIPSLIDKLNLKRAMTVSSTKAKRRIVKFNHRYYRFIGWGRRHKWVFLVVLILGFGLPIHLLPSRVGRVNISAQALNKWENLYNKTIGSAFYQENKGIFEKTLGGAFRLFSNPFSKYSPANENIQQRPRLYVRAAMVDGNTVHQLNQIMRNMENFLSQFEEIEIFRTSVFSYDNSQIEIMFKPEYENSTFPDFLYERVKMEAIRNGGATWQVWDISNHSFNNEVFSDRLSYLPYRIMLTGYNYDKLLLYADELLEHIKLSNRVKSPEIFDEGNETRPKQEFTITLNREKILTSGVNSGDYFSRLQDLLYSRSLHNISSYDKVIKTSMVSSEKESFDLWHVRNFPLDIDSVKVKLADIGQVDRKFSGRSIHRKNQNYQLTVAFDFIGSWDIVSRFLNSENDRLNQEVLPIGYRAEVINRSGWNKQEKRQAFLLIVLVIVLIYSISTVLFESWKKPLVIILLIPVSFIGVFLIFVLIGVQFNEGGFASFVMLSGLVVNAGIYVVNEYNNILFKLPYSDQIRIYIKSFNRKIIPVLLTILSTILGLVPFLIKMEQNTFWFTFAVGTIGGIVFSMLAFFIFLPAFLPLKKE